MERRFGLRLEELFDDAVLDPRVPAVEAYSNLLKTDEPDLTWGEWFVDNEEAVQLQQKGRLVGAGRAQRDPVSGYTAKGEVRNRPNAPVDSVRVAGLT